MRDPISIRSLLTAIRGLPSDTPVYSSSVWYRTQKEHWIGWLSEYDGPGAYGRQTHVNKRDARFAYNHINNPKMLLYLADAAGVDRKLVNSANRAYAKGSNSGAVRKIIPWETVATVLWSSYSV